MRNCHGQDLQVGDDVCFTANWLRSVGANPGPLPFARGIITEIEAHSSTLVIATVRWNDDRVGERVLLNNICRPGSLAACEVNWNVNRKGARS